MSDLCTRQAALVHAIVPVLGRLLGAQAHHTTQAHKKPLWQDICNTVNAVSSCQCSVENGKPLCDVKHIFKAKLAEELRYSHRTGNGPAAQIYYTDYKKKLKQAIPPALLSDMLIEDMDCMPSQGSPAAQKKKASDKAAERRHHQTDDDEAGGS